MHRIILPIVDPFYEKSVNFEWNILWYKGPKSCDFPPLTSMVGTFSKAYQDPSIIVGPRSFTIYTNSGLISRPEEHGRWNWTGKSYWHFSRVFNMGSSIFNFTFELYFKDTMKKILFYK